MTSQENILDNKIALIVGASSGIGATTAQRLADAGANVIVAARRLDKCQALADAIRQSGAKATALQADVNDTDSIRQLIADCDQQFGRLDIAFNNAGIEGTTFTPTADYEETVFRDVIDTNLTGIWRCMKYEIPLLKKSGNGCIINMASIAALGANEMMGCAYTASKHGIIGLTKTAAREYAADGLRINAICPGVIETDIASRSLMQNENLARKVLKMHPIGRLGRVEEVADAVLWLASPQNSFMTGQSLVIDGGVSC